MAILPTEPDYHFALGCALWQLEQTEDATEAFAEARALRGDDAGTLTALGAGLAHLGRYADARAHFEAAIAIAPRLAEAHAGLGAVLWMEDRRSEALRRLRRAARLRPDSVDIQANLGVALLESGRVDDALAALRRAAKLAADSAVAQLELADAAFAAGHQEEASQALSRAARADPTAIAARPSSLAVRDALQLERVLAQTPERAARSLGDRFLGSLIGVLHALPSPVGLRRPLAKWTATGTLVLVFVTLGRLLPPYVDHFLIRDDIAVVARAPVSSDAEVRDRLTHAVAARGLRHRIDPDRCEVTSRRSWRHIACPYEVPVVIVPGLRRTLAFRIDVEEPYVLPRESSVTSTGN